MASRRTVFYVIFAVLLLVAAGIVFLHPRPPAPHESSRRHGGDLVATKRHEFEVALIFSGALVHSYTSSGQPLPARALSGRAVLAPKGGQTIERSLRPVDRHEAVGFEDHLEAALDLKALNGQPAAIEFDIKGFDDPEEPVAHFVIVLNGS